MHYKLGPWILKEINKVIYVTVLKLPAQIIQQRFVFAHKVFQEKVILLWLRYKIEQLIDRLYIYIVLSTHVTDNTCNLVQDPCGAQRNTTELRILIRSHGVTESVIQLAKHIALGLGHLDEHEAFWEPHMEHLWSAKTLFLSIWFQAQLHYVQQLPSKGGTLKSI